MTTTSTSTEILIAGIGNIFQGDDAFGSEVARRLATRAWPANVRVVDFGIRAIDLTYALMDGYELTILVDATTQGDAPGTLYTIEPDLSEIENAGSGNAGFGDVGLAGHTMDPLKVLRTVRAMGGEFRKILLVGCEPADLGDEQGRLGMTEPVKAAVDEACEMVASLVEKHLASC